MDRKEEIIFSKKLNLGLIDYDHRGTARNRVILEIEITRKTGEFRTVDHPLDTVPEITVLSICGEIWQSNMADICSGGQIVEETRKNFGSNLAVMTLCDLWTRWHLNDMHGGCIHQNQEGWRDIRIDPAELKGSHSNRDERVVLATWVRPEEHPKGVLTRPCPTCGYEYGTAWLAESLPETVITEIRSLCDQIQGPTVKTEESDLVKYLAKQNIIFKAIHQGNGTGTWAQADRWLITFRRGKSPDRMTLYFHMGSGHNGKRPDPESVISCLTGDYSVASQSFEDFCSEFGYEEKEGKKLFRACGAQAVKINRFFTREEIKELFVQ